MARQLLNIDTLVERDYVTIDGQPYELRNPGELTLLEQARLGRRGEEMEALRQAMSERGPSDDEIARVTAVLEEMVRLVLLAPPEVIERLQEPHKHAIIGAFTAPQREAKAAPAAVPAPPKARRRHRPTGASTSPA